MNQQYLAHVSKLQFADFVMLFGPQRAGQLWPKFQTKLAIDRVQDFLLEIKNDEVDTIASLVKIRVRGAHFHLEGTEKHRMAVLEWLYKSGYPFMIVMSEKEHTPGNSDWAILMNLQDYQLYKDEQASLTH